jgi:hypothetical protein
MILLAPERGAFQLFLSLKMWFFGEDLYDNRQLEEWLYNKRRHKGQ